MTHFVVQRIVVTISCPALLGRLMMNALRGLQLVVSHEAMNSYILNSDIHSKDKYIEKSRRRYNCIQSVSYASGRDIYHYCKKQM